MIELEDDIRWQVEDIEQLTAMEQHERALLDEMEEENKEELP